MSISTNITNIVREKYGSTATAGLSSNDIGVRAVAEAFGYSADELSSIPAEANMGLSCGNPTATANIREGETVVDLGSGGGLDVFLAAKKVGPTGRAIGIDMTPQMIELARKNAAKAGVTNVEFHLASIDKLPLPDASVDIILSNCVINLAPDKPRVFREMARVLKPGGRVAVSDIALKKPLPAELAEDVMSYVGCIAGAIAIADYERGLKDAGFVHVQIVDSGADLNAYAQVEGQSACCSPAPAAAAATEAASPCCTPAPAAAEATEPCCTPAPAAAGTEPASACCTPAPAATAKSATLAISSGCCCGGGGSGAATATKTESASTSVVHYRLTELMKRYNVNDYAASVKVFAVKPQT
jgi:SAM-dependent methyltransferase